MSVSAFASTATSPPEATDASSPIKASVVLFRTTASPVIPTPTSAPPPDPETDVSSVSDSASTETDWLSELLSVALIVALSLM